MTEISPSERVAVITKFIGSILADLASNQASWLRVKEGVSLLREKEFPERLLRLRNECVTLSQLPISEVRQILVDSLGTTGYAYLLNLSDEQKQQIADEATYIESDLCASESYRPIRSFSLDYAGRIPSILSYMNERAGKAFYPLALEEPLKFFIQDLVSDEGQWLRCEEFDLKDTLIEIRGLLSFVSEGQESPRDVHQWLKNIIGEDGIAQLSDSINTNPSDLCTYIKLEEQPKRYYSPTPIFETSPSRNFPKLAVYLAQWVTLQFGFQHIGQAMKIILAAVAQKQTYWSNLEELESDQFFWQVRDIATQIRSTSPVQINEWLAMELPKSGYLRLWNLSKDELNDLGRRLYDAKQTELRGISSWSQYENDMNIPIFLLDTVSWAKHKFSMGEYNES